MLSLNLFSSWSLPELLVKLIGPYLGFENDATLEEGRSRIKSDAVDRDNIRKSLENCLHPFRTSTHPKEIVNIYTGILSDELVNVDRCVDIGAEQVSSFYKLLPGGFHEPLSKKMITMSSMKKTVKVGNVEVADTFLIFHHVIALQLAKEIFKYELAPFPMALFDQSGDWYA